MSTIGSTQDKLVAQVALVFGRVIPDAKFDVGRSMENTATWSSLRHVQLLSGLETEFGVEFDPIHIARLTSVEAIVAFLASRAR